MPARDALVAEVAVEFENFRKAADEQALEIQLRRDAQEEVHAKRVVVRLERSGRRAAGDGLHHGRLDFDKPAILEEAADFADDGDALVEDGARILVRDEVEVALAVFDLGVLHAMPLVGQRAERLREHGEIFHADRGLAGARDERLALDANEVAKVEVLEDRERLVADLLRVNENLDAPRRVGHVEELALAHVAVRGNAAGHAERGAFGKFARTSATVPSVSKACPKGATPASRSASSFWRRMARSSKLRSVPCEKATDDSATALPESGGNAVIRRAFRERNPATASELVPCGLAR